MKRVKGLVLDDQQWAALVELVAARAVDLRGYHGLREDFVQGPGLFNVVWPADDKLLAVFAQLTRMGLPPPELVEGWETAYVSEEAARTNGVTRPPVAGEWGGCSREHCPLCTHAAPLGLFLDQADAKLVEDTTARIRARNPSFDPATAPLGGDEPGEEMEPGSTPAPATGAAVRKAPPGKGGEGLVIPATAASAPEPEPEPAGPPLVAEEVDGRIVLRVPAERWSLDLVGKLGARDAGVIRRGDRVSGRLLDRLATEGAGFVAPLPYFSEVFADGKPLDRKRFEEESTEIAPGIRAMEALLPRYGTVRVVVGPQGRFVTSEVALPAEKLLPLLG